MLWNDSVSLSPDKFQLLVTGLAVTGRADLFLSSGGYPGETGCYIGVDPIANLVVSPSTTKSHLTAFAFSSPHPTLGYLSYNYGLAQRNIASVKATSFGLGHLKKYGSLLYYDYSTQILEMNHAGGDRLDLDETQRTAYGIRAEKPMDGFLTLERQSLSRSDYVNAVVKTLEAIRDGYIYQLNLSIKYTADAEQLDPATLFLFLREQYPAPFYVYFHSGDHTIISTSPERFIRVDHGRVLSQPIKGTLAFRTFDHNLVKQLTSSSKEAAELSMIVDMVRNDISLNCEYGSVKVADHKSTFVVDNMLQMYSNVIGQLKPGKTCLDLFLDAFPGGSVTGCPKQKAMEIIDRLEPHSRDVYCGSFFIIKDEQTMDSSICIRTGYFCAPTRKFHFFAGSGIVVDSQPESEYDETTAKARKFLDMCRYPAK